MSLVETIATVTKSENRPLVVLTLVPLVSLPLAGLALTHLATASGWPHTLEMLGVQSLIAFVATYAAPRSNWKRPFYERAAVVVTTILLLYGVFGLAHIILSAVAAR